MVSREAAATTGTKKNTAITVNAGAPPVSRPPAPHPAPLHAPPDRAGRRRPQAVRRVMYPCPHEPY